MPIKTDTTPAASELPTRRTFLHHAAVAAGAAGAFTILPSRVAAGQRKLSPNDKLNLGADRRRRHGRIQPEPVRDREHRGAL